MSKYLIAALWLFASLSAHSGERLAGANVDVRTTLAFKASDFAIGKLVPPGWVSSPIAAGPYKGANVTLILVDSQFASDANGTPLPPFHGMVLAVPAKKAGTDLAGNLIVFGIVDEGQFPGPYGVYLGGKASIERTATHSTEAGTTIKENWSLSANDGNKLEIAIQFQRGLATKVKSESRTYSGIHPEFYRIYQLDQTADVVKSSATGVDRVGRLTFRASGPRLAQIFDGTEQLIGVTSIPAYSRTVLLPD